MKKLLFILPWALYLSVVSAQSSQPAPNIFIITTDGFRWQEMFNGADPSLMSDTAYVKDPALIEALFGGATSLIRRQKLLPFIWSTLANQGQLYGNRAYKNNADVKNIYKISYAGYNEIFTGYADPRFVPNTPRLNQNTNLPAWLNGLPEYKGAVAAFTSWNIFPYILNEKKNGFPVNSGYEHTIHPDAAMSLIDQVQDSIHGRKACRNDLLTFLLAKQYIEEQHPKCVILGLGETDEFAHSSRYDVYLQKANQFDKMLADLWYLVQTDPFYKDNSIFVITTDHGRGNNINTWANHHLFIKGSGEIWLAMLGPGIAPKGEITQPQQVYQNQIAQTIAGLLGKKFVTEHRLGKPIALPGTPNKKDTAELATIIASPSIP